MVELTPVPVMIILLPPPTDAATGINNPFDDIPTVQPELPVKLQTDKSLTNVVHALFAVMLLPIILEFVNAELIILHTPPKIDDRELQTLFLHPPATVP